MKKSSHKWLNTLLLSAIVVAVAYYICINIGELKTVEFRLKPALLLLSFAALLVAYLFSLLIWYRIAIEYGINKGIAESGKVWALSNLGKYIPGKIAPLLIRFDLYKSFPKKNIGMATITEYLSSLASSCIIVLTALFSSPIGLPSYYRMLILIGFVFLAVVLHPKILQSFVNRALLILRKTPIEKYPPYRTTLKYVIAYLLPNLFFGISFFLLVNSLQQISFNYFIIITGISVGAGLIGMAAFFAPGGIGVCEGFLMLVLPTFVPKPTVIVSVILFRLVLTAAELFLAGLFVLLEKKNRYLLE